MEKKKQRLKRFNNAIKRSGEAKQTKFEKLKNWLKSFFGLKTETKKKNNMSLKKSTKTDEHPNLTNETRTTAKKNKDKPRLQQFNYGVKRTRDETEKPVKSLRVYIKTKWKWVVLLFITYITILGATVSTPIVLNHLRDRNQNKTQQGRFIIRKFSVRDHSS